MLAPDVLYYQRPVLLDAAMFQAQAYVLGVTHLTGYPTYLLLTHLFTYLPFGDPAYRVNLASAVFGAVAVFLVLAERRDKASGTLGGRGVDACGVTNGCAASCDLAQNEDSRTTPTSRRSPNLQQPVLCTTGVDCQVTR